MMLRLIPLLTLAASAWAFIVCQRPPNDSPMVVFSSPPVMRTCGSIYQTLRSPVPIPFVLQRGMLPANQIQFKFGFLNRLVADGHKVAQFVTIQPTYISGVQSLVGGATLVACMFPIEYDGASTQELMQGANYGIVEEFGGPCLNNQYTSSLTVSLYQSPNALGTLNWDSNW